MKDKNLDQKMEQLANMLADGMLGGAEVDPDTINCFKALSGYYTATRKLNKSQETDNGAFDLAKQRVADAEKQTSRGANGADKPDHDSFN